MSKEVEEFEETMQKALKLVQEIREVQNE